MNEQFSVEAYHLLLITLILALGHLGVLLGLHVGLPNFVGFLRGPLERFVGGEARLRGGARVSADGFVDALVVILEIVSSERALDVLSEVGQILLVILLLEVVPVNCVSVCRCCIVIVSR